MHIKSSYFEQKVDITFFLHSRDSATLSRSPSPSRRYEAALSGVPKDAYETISELQGQLKARDSKIKHMEEAISQLESKFPSLQEIVRSRVEQERLVFEEKSEKVCGLCVFLQYSTIY